MRAEVQAFANKVPSGKTFIFSLQMSINIVSLFKHFGRLVFQNRTRQSSKTLPATSRQKNQTVTLDTKLHLDITKLADPCVKTKLFYRLEKAVFAVP